jgi:outer membrane usher protein
MELRRERWVRSALLGATLVGALVSLAWGDDLADFLKRQAKAGKSAKTPAAESAPASKRRKPRAAADTSGASGAEGAPGTPSLVGAAGAPGTSRPAARSPEPPPATEPPPSPRVPTTTPAATEPPRQIRPAAATANQPSAQPAARPAAKPKRAARGRGAVPATAGQAGAVSAGPAPTGTAQAPEPLEDIPGAKPGDQRAILTLSVNLVDKGEIYVVLRQGDVLVGVEDLEAAGVNGFTGLREVIGGKHYVSLSSLAPNGTTYAFDERALTLSITVPVTALGKSVLDLATRRPPETIEADVPSAFGNYALRLDNFHELRAFGELGATFRNALLYTQLSVQPNGHAVRGLTYLTYSERPEMRRWIAGDTFAASGPLGGGLFMGGLSVVRDFGLDPYFYRFPSVGLGGTATTPSTVDVYVNNTLVRREQISPGNFQVNNLPVPVGAGNARVVVRDAFGREQTIATPFYFSAGILKQGLSDYGFHAGFQRNNIANESWNYAPPLLLGRYRLGLTNDITAGARFEGTTHLASGGPNATVRTLLGDFEGAAAASGGSGFRGAAGSLSYSFLGQSLSAGAVARLLSDHYANVTLAPWDDRATRQVDAFVGTSLSPRISVTGRFGGARFRDAGTAYQAGLLGNLSIAPGVNLFVTANRTSSTSPAPVPNNGMPGITPASATTRPIYDAFVTLSVALPDRVTASAFVAQHDSQTSGGAEVQRSLPIGPGYGYRVRGSTSEAPGTSTFSASAQAQSEYGRYDASYDRVGERDHASVGVAGGVVALGGNVFATRPVQQSYGLIQVPGAPGVRGYLNNHEVGRTDRNGNLLIPELIPYYSNRLGIADQDLPIDYKVEEIEKVLSTPLRGGGVARFDVQRIRTVTGSVAMELADKNLSPAYGQLTVHDGLVSVSSPLGREGEFYFDSLHAGTFDAEVDSAVGTCRFKLEVPARDEPFIDVGRIKCMGTAPVEAPVVETPPGVVTPIPPAAAAPATPAAAPKTAPKRAKRGGAK